MSVEYEGRIEMKKLLRLSGISPVDLHHWVRRGLLPRACGRVNGSGPGSTYYYPAWAVDRARDIKRLRDQGVSGQKIRKILRGEKVKL
ncbi:hypothetical protein ES703_76497 [subsurface metagenome]